MKLILILLLSLTAFSNEKLGPVAFFEMIGEEPISMNETRTFDHRESYAPHGHIVKYEWYINNEKVKELDLEKIKVHERNRLFFHHFPNEIAPVSVKLVVTDNENRTSSYQRNYFISPYLHQEFFGSDEAIIIGSQVKFPLGENSWSVNGEKINYLTGNQVKLGLDRERDNVITMHFLENNEEFSVSKLVPSKKFDQNNPANNKPQTNSQCIKEDENTVVCRITVDGHDLNKAYLLFEGVKSKMFDGNIYKFKNIKDKRIIVGRIISENISVAEIEIDISESKLAREKNLISLQTRNNKQNISKDRLRVGNIFSFDFNTYGPDLNYKFKWVINNQIMSENQRNYHYSSQKSGEHKVQLIVENENGFVGSDEFIFNIPKGPEVEFEKTITEKDQYKIIDYRVKKASYSNGEVVGLFWSLEKVESKEYYERQFFQGENAQFIIKESGSYLITLRALGSDEIMETYKENIEHVGEDFYLLTYLSFQDTRLNNLNEIYLGDKRIIKLYLKNKGLTIKCKDIDFSIHGETDLNYKLDKEKCELLIDYAKESNSLEHKIIVTAKYKNMKTAHTFNFVSYPLLRSVNFYKKENYERYSFDNSDEILKNVYFKYDIESAKKEHKGVFDIYALDKNGNVRINLRNSTPSFFNVQINKDYKFLRQLSVPGLISGCSHDDCRYDLFLSKEK